VHHGTGTTAIVIVRRFVVKLVSGSVRVRVTARASARVTVRDSDRI